MLKDTTWIHAELSSRCQAMCPDCPRNDYGYKLRKDYPERDLTINDWKKIFDGVHLPYVNQILFNGNFGDPLINDDLIDIIEYCHSRWGKLDIHISTNGGIRNVDWWKKFGEKSKYWKKRTKVLVAFCIDGLEDTQELYRINVPYKKAIENAKAFINAGGRAYWRMVPFAHNEHQINAARSLAKEYGFTKLVLNDCDRDNLWVFTDDVNGYYITPTSDKKQLKLASHEDVYTPNLDRNWNTEYLKNLDHSWKEYDNKIKCFAQDTKTFYISSSGEIYPCCWTGMYPKTYAGKGSSINFKQAIGDLNNNALEIGLEEAYKSLQKVYDTFNKPICYDETERGNCPAVCVDCSIKNLSNKFKK
jgi:MoaA/NifB/PqqE/SkfB family radical SAM enzyme